MKLTLDNADNHLQDHAAPEDSIRQNQSGLTKSSVGLVNSTEFDRNWSGSSDVVMG
jgi:hypothetical protein